MARSGVAYAMGGNNSAFLPQNYGFNDLASYEEQRRRQLGQNYGQSINEFTNQYTTDAAKRRSALSDSLNSSGQKFFEQNNPYLLEDLNSRGLLTSPSAVGQSQAEALKQIDLANQDKLNAFDTQTYGDENQLKLSGLTGQLQANQDALDSGLDLRRTDLESRLQDANANREEALANSLADKQGRNSLYGSLIGAGGSIGSALLGAKALGGAGLFGGGSTAGGAATAGILSGSTAGTLGGTALTTAGAPASSLFPGGLGAVGTGSASGVAGGGLASALLPVAGVGAGLGLYEEGRKLLRKEGFGSNASKALSAIPGVGLSVGLANKALGGALSGRKSNGTGNGDATATQQRQLDSEFEQLKSLKETDPAAYQEQAQQAIDGISQRVAGLTSRNSAWANAINPNWQRFVNAGLVKAQDGKWVAV